MSSQTQLTMDQLEISVDELTSVLHPLELRLRRSPTVFIAAINGSAAGGGLGLALCADYRLCIPEARLAAAFFLIRNFTRWRFDLAPSTLGRIPNGLVIVSSYNEVWTGEQALEYGAVDELVNSRKPSGQKH